MTSENNANVSKPLPLALILCVVGILLGISYHFRLWELDENGLSLVSKTTPYWDFNNLWFGSKLALEGHVDWLFEPDKYRAAMRDRISPDIPNHEWSYPPSLLLLGSPLAKLPELYAYILWTFGTVFALFLSVRTLKLPKTVTVAIILSPAVFYNSIYGQNGALIAALLIASLTLAPKKPVLAGICIGLLTVKPQFGILIPFILIASGNWKTIISASVTTIALVLITGFAYGFDTWSLFLSETQPLMKSIMEAPYLQPYQINAGTLFISMRAAGASLGLSYGVQMLASLTCLIYAIWIWRKNHQMDHKMRVAITCILIFLATPYAYTYDMVPIAVAIAIFYHLRPEMKWAPLLGLAWLFPLFNHIIVVRTYFNFGGLVLLIILGVMLYNLHRDERKSLGA